MEEKHLLDLISAIVSGGILAGRAKSSPKDAAKMFFQVRDELLKGMLDNELRELPIYLSQRFPRAAKR
jgi:hypothetical protein